MRGKRVPKRVSLAYTFKRYLARIAAGMLAIKDQVFQEEKEWRLVIDSAEWSFRTGRFGILPYFAIPLCDNSENLTFEDLYVGPHPEPDIARDTVQEFIRSQPAYKQARLEGKV